MVVEAPGSGSPRHVTAPQAVPGDGETTAASRALKGEVREADIGGGERTRSLI